MRPTLAPNPCAEFGSTVPASPPRVVTAPDDPKHASQVRWILEFNYSSKERAKSVHCYACEGPKTQLDQDLDTPALVIFNNAHVFFTETPIPVDQAFCGSPVVRHQNELRMFGESGWEALKPGHINNSLWSVGVLLGAETHPLTKAMYKTATMIIEGCVDVSEDVVGDCTAEAKNLAVQFCKMGMWNGKVETRNMPHLSGVIRTSVNWLVVIY